MRRYILLWIGFMLFVVGSVTSCNNEAPTETPTTAPIDDPAPTNEPATPTLAPATPTGETVRGQASVDSIQIITLESFPVQVNVRVRGELPDGCTTIDEIITQQTDNAFQSAITTIRPGDAVCTTESVPFEEIISLDVLDLDAGTYAVTVNGISGSFTLDIDNRIPEESLEPTPTATAVAEPVDASSAAISGQVWHDLCPVVIVEEEGEEPPTPDGCLALTDGGFQANGVLEDEEPGIAGVLINLGEGECPSDGLAVTTTDDTGTFAFNDLPASTYCVSIDPLAEENSDILLPGQWTFPDVDENQTTVTVTEGQAETDINFGWDYQFLPIPEVDVQTCDNSVAFVDDLTIPDNTVLAPGAAFIKTWRLRNNGTCPWTAEYTLVAVDDEPLEGDTVVPLETAVAPGQTIEASVTLTAPVELGTYRSNWQMADANGLRFGVDGFIEDAFWLQIVVSDTQTTTATLDSGVIGGVVWADFCRILTDGPSVGCQETAEDSGVFIADGTLNFNEDILSDITVGLGEGACPQEGSVPASDILTTTTTGADGRYQFTDLDGGTYCVFIDAFQDDNVDLLIPGEWTYPAPGVGRLGIILAEGEERLTVDFGWDFLD